ncbi:DUF3267 domain-containing protein [Bacillus enclensis]|nr:DUF3267 domain-containing protein [[Bacillus] enclensis]
MNSFQKEIAVKGSKKEKVFEWLFAVFVFSIGLFFVMIKMTIEKESLLLFFNLCREWILFGPTVLILFFLFIMLGNIGFTYVHEFLHLVFARLYKYESWTEIKVNWRKLLPSAAKCHFGERERVKRNSFLVILLAPLAAFIVLFFLGFYYIGLPVIFFMVLMCFKITGCIGDLIMFYQS